MITSAPGDTATSKSQFTHPAWGRARSLLAHFSKLDLAMLLIWLMSTAIPWGWTQPLRYIAAAYFVGAFVLFSRQTMPALARSWPMFILPTMCVISALWAPVANDAIRKGMLMALTALPAVYIAVRLSGRQTLAVVVVALATPALMSVASPNVIGGAWNGIFGQKNYLSGTMLLLHIAAMGVAFDKDSNRWLRLGAFGMMLVAMLLIVMAKSATITLLMGGATLALTGHYLLWGPAHRVRHMRSLLVAVLLFITLALLLIVFGLLQFDFMNSVLEAFGKDSTLTGRTYLWSIAERIMAERPLTGMGADGFWRAERGVANSITQYFFHERYVPFSFHNSYIENGVSFGYPGYWATVFLAAWALWRTGMTWLRNQNAVNAAFLMMAITTVIRTNAEIDLALEFMSTAFLLFIGAARKETLPKLAYAPIAPPPPQAQAPSQAAP
jgi:exopolysaccharide production protein ExoQ